MIRLHQICWQAPGATFALLDIDLHVPPCTYAVLMGSTGCGKTTLMEILCGLRMPSSGRVEVNGFDVTRKEPRHRHIGYLPQDLALFPEMKVVDQIGFSPRVRGKDRDAIRSAVEALADELGITHLLDRRPQNLSGGEKQRVALARALAAEPAVLLLDEPLSALDEARRDDVAALLKNLQQKHQLTVIHVTHSRTEAEALADLRLSLRDGKIFAE
jgi:molybdate/tungstate transport system ATP-binding protein